MSFITLHRKILPALGRVGLKCNRFLSSATLPHHLVIGMPALSPTMESGTIASWRVAEGDSFHPGDSLAEIQTDKASMAFEAQDGGYVAKLLVKAGDGADIKIGEPILVTVEEKEYVSAFKDFVVFSDLTVKKSAPESTPPVTPAEPVVSINTNVSEVKAVLPTSSPSAPVVKAENQVTSIQPKSPATQTIMPTPTTNVAISSISAPISSISTSPLPTVGPSWGNLARVVSPLSKILSAEQKKYIEKFGSTGQSPL